MSSAAIPASIPARRRSNVASWRPQCRFANGVALSEDESFVAIAETAGFRIHRFWLKVSLPPTYQHWASISFYVACGLSIWRRSSAQPCHKGNTAFFSPFAGS
eukprot:scaffold226415_cov19-Tisochrysis_lutea.AAC.2